MIKEKIFKNKLKYFLYFISIFLCIISLVSSFYLTPFFIHNYCTANLPQGSSLEHCNYENFSGIQLKLIAFAFIWLLVFLFLLVFNKELFSIKIDTKKIPKFFYKIKKDYKKNKIHYWFLFVIILLGILVRVYYLNIPMKTDESSTYVWYASWPAYISQSLYTYPNNHLFHTLLVKVSTAIFGSSEVAIRLPAFIFGILNMFISYYLGRKFFNKEIGILLCSFVTISGYFIEYSIEARGYSIVAFFAIASIIIANRILNKNKLKSWLLLALCLALSVYTIPSMIYFVIIIYLWVIYEKRFNLLDKKFLKNLIISSMLLLILITVLYYPVILISGLNSIIKNKAVKSYSFSYVLNNLFPYLDKFVKSLYLNFPLINAYGWIIFSSVGLILANIINKKNRIVSLLNLFIPIILILMILQRVLPFVRTYLWVFPIFYLLLSIFFYYIFDCLFKNKKNVMLNIFCIVIVLLGVYNFGSIYKNNFNYLGDTRLVYNYLNEKLENNSCIVLFNISQNPYEYYFTKEYFREIYCKKGKEYDLIYGIINPELSLNNENYNYLSNYAGTKVKSFDKNDIWLFIKLENKS